MKTTTKKINWKEATPTLIESLRAMPAFISLEYSETREEFDARNFLTLTLRQTPRKNSVDSEAWQVVQALADAVGLKLARKNSEVRWVNSAEGVLAVKLQQNARVQRPIPEEWQNLKPGDILNSYWGWEQTNCEFYRVVSVTPSTVKVRKIVSDYTPGGHDFTGWVKPCKSRAFCPSAPVLTVSKRARHIPKQSFRHLEVWSGKAIDVSSYA